MRDWRAFYQKYQERIVLFGVAVAFLFLVGGGIYLQKRNKQKDNEPKALPTKIEIARPQKKGSVNQATDSEESKKAVSFFLKPSPDELMQQIAELDSLDERVATKKYTQLPVMWPVYFFALIKKEGNMVTVQFDVSEDGFGVVVTSDVDVTEYPEISDIESGKKIWVAGVILAVDPSGTGTVYLKTDYFRFTDPLIRAEATTDAQKAAE